jgi:ParB family chromosome partitioning protein
LSNPGLELTRKLAEIKDKKTNPLTRSILIQELTISKNLGKKEVAYLIGKSPSYISNYLRLIDLPEVIKDALLSGILSEGHARALTFLGEKSEIIQVFEDIVRYNYSVRETERRVDKVRKTKRFYGKVEDDLRETVDSLKEKWGIEASVSRRRQQIVLGFSFPLGVVGLRKLKTFLARLS